jgi:aryl-alcohol dehydrogenase-like predicted oxidoreductase
MQTRRIGSLNVSVVGLGCNNFGMAIDERRTREVVAAALDAGVNFFDTADVYGSTHSEEFLGRALGSRRNDAIIATKFGLPIDEQRKGAHPDYVRRAADDSLRRLNTNHIDLYQLHKPDPSVPIADTLGALHDLVQRGKVREIGCSNMSASQIREADAAGRAIGVRFVSVQNEYSLLHREPEDSVLPECDRLGLAFLPFFPLASGLLTGKYTRGTPAPEGTRLQKSWAASIMTDANFDKVEPLSRFAESRRHTLLELAFSWLLHQRSVASVIAGATSPDQIRKNASGAGWQLSVEEMAEIDRLAPRS